MVIILFSSAALHLINKRNPDQLHDWIRMILEDTLDESRYEGCPAASFESYAGVGYGI